jgi:ATPase subunit of ABC transporter with duplicated ATPase domains
VKLSCPPACSPSWAAAALRSYDGALLIVSHDEAFLENIETSRSLELSLENRIEKDIPSFLRQRNNKI